MLVSWCIAETISKLVPLCLEHTTHILDFLSFFTGHCYFSTNHTHTLLCRGQSVCTHTAMPIKPGQQLVGSSPWPPAYASSDLWADPGVRIFQVRLGSYRFLTNRFIWDETHNSQWHDNALYISHHMYNCSHITLPILGMQLCIISTHHQTVSKKEKMLKVSNSTFKILQKCTTSKVNIKVS